MDEQSGAVTRKLQKAHETFDIENAKIAKREQKVPVPYPFLPLPLAIALWCRSGRLAVGSVGGWVGGRVGVGGWVDGIGNTRTHTAVGLKLQLQ